MPSKLLNLPGRVENRGGRRKYVEKPEPLYVPLKGDGATGIGEKGRSYFDGPKNPKKTRAFRKPQKKNRGELDMNSLFKPSGLTSY
jgi:hypothetical protein